jgi:hypothetical protein
MLCIVFSISSYSQEVFRTEVFREDIKSLEIKVDNEIISNPFIELNSDRKIVISFDALHHSMGRFVYKVIHCNSDWKESSLLPVEYIKGFHINAIEDFANSFNTTVNYTNYRVEFPNEYTQITETGNYAIKIYDESSPEITVLTVCFSVYDPLLQIEASVSSNTDIDFNKNHQQIEFTLHHSDINIPFPQNDLKIFVYQNNNINDIRTNIEPLIYTSQAIQYRRNKNLIFEAGNEYRRIEFLTHRYNGMGVENISYHNPYYHAVLLSDKKRSNKPYLYDQDQNGRFFINCSNCEDPATESDYYIVHFSLESELLIDGSVFLYGDAFNNILNEKSIMEYNSETGRYEKFVMLKQGLYNYMYMFKNNESNISLGEIEGNYYETENEYTILVYYRPIGARHDRLIGFKHLKNNLGQLSSKPINTKCNKDLPEMISLNLLQSSIKD